MQVLTIYLTGKQISSMCMDKDGRLLMTIPAYHSICRLDFHSLEWTMLSSSQYPGCVNGSLDRCRFHTPEGIVCAPDGTIFLCDMYNHQIRCLDLKKRTVDTLAGRSVSGWADGIGCDALFRAPKALAIRDRILFVLEQGNRAIRRIDIGTRIVTTLTGFSLPCPISGYANGTLHETVFNSPSGICFDPDGESLIISDSGNNRIRKINLQMQQSSTLIGTGEAKTADGTLETACLYHPKTSVYDQTGKLFICQSNNCPLRMFDPTTSLVSSPKELQTTSILYCDEYNRLFGQDSKSGSCVIVITKESRHLFATQALTLLQDMLPQSLLLLVADYAL